MTDSIKTPPSLAKQAWLKDPRLQDVMRVITKAGADKVVEQCWQLDQASNVSKLMESLKIKD